MAEAEEPVKVTADQLGVKEGCGTYAAGLQYRTVLGSPSPLMSCPTQSALHFTEDGPMPTGRSMTVSWNWTWAT